MSPGVQRMRTERAFRTSLAVHGATHPATWSAWARAVAAWGIRRAPRIPSINPPTFLLDLAAVAYARATSGAGDSNRTARRRAQKAA